MAWWLAYEELYGDMDKEYPIMSKDDVTILGGDLDDTITFTGDGVGAADTINFGTPLPGGMGEDHISFTGSAGTAYDDPKYFSVDFGDDPYPTVGAVDEVYKFHFPGTEKPQPDLTSEQTQK